jgi:hypothetical protein
VTTRRFPPPRSIEDTAAAFVVKDGRGLQRASAQPACGGTGISVNE